VFFGSGACGSIGFLELFATSIRFGPVSLPSPQITSTLFFFIRKPTPAFMRCAMPRERSTIAFRSGVALPSILTP
jgi:hypothetical protein